MMTIAGSSLNHLLDYVRDGLSCGGVPMVLAGQETLHVDVGHPQVSHQPELGLLTVRTDRVPLADPELLLQLGPVVDGGVVLVQLPFQAESLDLVVLRVADVTKVGRGVLIVEVFLLVAQLDPLPSTALIVLFIFTVIFVILNEGPFLAFLLVRVLCWRRENEPLQIAVSDTKVTDKISGSHSFVTLRTFCGVIKHLQQLFFEVNQGLVVVQSGLVTEWF